MNTRAYRRRMLVEMRDELMQRLEQVQADVDAANRLIAAHESTDQPIAPSSVEEIRQCSITCLAEHGEPMHRQDLLGCLIAQGVHIVGKIQVNNLGAILSRYSDDFISHGQGKWGLKSKWIVKNGVKTPGQLPSSTDGNGVSVDEAELPF